MKRLLLLLILLLPLAAPRPARAEEGALMRYADIHGPWIVFTWEDDLWLVGDQGGLARRLTRHPGEETWARFSPDGSLLAFTANYDGGVDVYVMDAMGGVPRRLTYHPARDRVLGWTPDGSAVLFRSSRRYPSRAEEIYTVPVEGGMPRRLPIDRGGLAALDAQGRRLAYNRISRESATWKRYQGGEAQEIWIADLQSGGFQRLTEWVGTDNFPMWHDGKVFFDSDRSGGTLNLFSKDPETGEIRQWTDFTDYDVKYPSMGDGRIVFQYGERLHVLDLDTGEVRQVEVQLPSDEVPMRPEWVEVEHRGGTFQLSPDGDRALVESRGEILLYPTGEGEAFNLSRSSGSREKNAVFSPDGKWIAWISDASGEEQVHLMAADGQGEARQLTHREGGFLRHLVFSPDSRSLLLGDKYLRLSLVDVETGRERVVDQGEWDDAWERWGITDYVFSPDGKWIAYSKQSDNMNEGIYLVPAEGGEPVRVTEPLYNSWSPSFSDDGKYLYFLSNRTYDPIMGRQDQNHIFLDMARPYLVLLQEGQASPFRPDADEAAGEGAEKSPAVRIDLEGIQDRILACEGVEAGDWWRLESVEGGFLLLKLARRDFLKYQNIDDRTWTVADLWKWDRKEASSEEVLPGILNYHLSADGKKLIYRHRGGLGVVDAGAEAKVGDGELDLSRLRLRVDRHAEYHQIFDEAWRIQRDWFYDPGMHGVDWPAVREKYRPLVDHCGTRGDLVYLIGEMIGELNIGHTYVWGGDEQSHYERVPVGLLGCDFETAEGASYPRIARVIDGVNWDERDRSPLAEPGCPIGEGDYLIAVDGVEVPAGGNVYAAFVDKADRWVTLTFNDRPSADGARTWKVKTLSSENPLRYRAWVEANRAKVEKWSDGKVGYLHLPDMGEAGLREFGRYFYPQTDKQALVIDDRYNAGGFTGDMIIDRLERKLWGITKPREGGVGTNPEKVLHGPLVVLINEDTGSNGEYFATAIQIDGLAPVVGMRTWGGAVGIEPHQDLVDGGTVTPPQFGLYGLDGTWLIEGRGVVPDVEVQNEPASVVAGEDTQLRRGVQMLLDSLREDPERWAIPPVPPFPDKSKAAGR